MRPIGSSCCANAGQSMIEAIFAVPTVVALFLLGVFLLALFFGDRHP